ncbi:alkaline phosphatase D family protein [Sphingomonas jatrophae]|uniref:Alkaline phosphatase D n=1 Tax=Sphingomonas jatrophae TaxID=1166337 RepID=A0A1I6JEC6_9SPHN|nr:alkaline phosphatase D family protein [Sphingomonas jatrophae]SFR77383.1 alkaline phosphatase D [Sphingomonas jatrophae]
MDVSRRGALGLFGAGAALPVIGADAKAVGVTFRHGVAAGDPTAGGAILWTRVTPADPTHNAAVPVRWSVSEREGGQPVATGWAEARPARDFTVKVEPEGLKPGRDYWYRFEAEDGTASPSGRFRTLPVGATPDAVFAVVSCQLYGGGLFNAYDAIAKLPRLDAVLHLGDYIYEYDTAGYGEKTARKLGREVQPDREIVSLADYRQRHACYKLDPDLQAAHARAAMIAVWDDHEVANDGWLSGAQNHQPATEGDWKARKAAAMQAYFEWMPIRDPAPGKPWEAINRSFQYGDLATLLMVETRLLARSEQVAFKHQGAGTTDFAAVLAERNRPDRELLGEPQRAWVADTLTASVKAGTPWQVIGNQVVMARVPGPQLDRMIGPEKAAAAMAALPDAVRGAVVAQLAGYKAGVPYNLDAWDGYPAARERLYASFREAGSRPIVLSGDSHAFWANDLFDDGGTLVAAEFGTSAISSPSVGDELPQLPLGPLLEQAGDEVAFCDQRAKGFVLLTIDRDAARAEYFAVSTILAKPYEVRTIARYEAGAAAKGARLKRLG